MAIENQGLTVQTNDDRTQNEEQGFEIDLVELLYRLLEKARWIILAALVGALIMGIYTFRFVDRTYQATSRLYILNSKDSVVNLSDLQMGTNLAADYVQAFKTYTIHRQVREDLGLDYSISQMTKMLNVTNVSGTRILSLTVTSTDGEEAVRMADKYAEYGRMFIADHMGTTEPRIFEAASERGYTVAGPNKTRNILLGFIVGFVAAAAVIVVQFIVDDRVRNAEALEKKLHLPVLGMMPAADMADASSSHRSSRKHSGKKGGSK